MKLFHDIFFILFVGSSIVMILSLLLALYNLLRPLNPTVEYQGEKDADVYIFLALAFGSAIVTIIFWLGSGLPL